MALHPHRRFRTHSWTRPRLLCEALEPRWTPTAGALDPAFSGDGKTTFEFGAASDLTRAVVLQSDGRILVAGSAALGNNEVFSVARYTAAGVLDTTFDGDGVVHIDFATFTDRARAIAVQADGKIVVAGSTGFDAAGDFAVARLNSDGSLDATFDGDGKATYDLGTDRDQCTSLAIQSDGKIVIAGGMGLTPDTNFVALRINSDGSKDATFDGDGLAIIDFDSNLDIAFAVAIQPDGKILLVGEAHMNSAGQQNFGVVRLDATGALDPTFDGDGKGDYGISVTADHATCLALQSDGRIVVGGYNINNDFAVIRVTAAGALDTTFDGDGKATFDFGGSSDIAYSVAVRADSKILLSGVRVAGGVASVAVARLLSTGAPDPAFDTDGLATFDLGPGNDVVFGMVLQPDDRALLVGGQGGNAVVSTSSFSLDAFGFLHSDNVAVLRLTAAGAPDPAFSGDGIALHSAGVSDDSGVGVVVQPDGKIIALTQVAGIESLSGINRYNSNGTLDATFSGDGSLVFEIGQFLNNTSDLLVQPDGKIVVGGFANSTSEFALARLNSDGSFDTSFSGDGKTFLDIGSTDRLFALALQSDGRIVAAGSTPFSGIPHSALARFNSDGTTDFTFNGSGFKTFQAGFSDELLDLAIQPDGKIVFAGYQNTSGSRSFLVGRLNSNGSFDGTFDGDGLKSFQAASTTFSSANTVALLPDGKILVAGYAFIASGADTDFCIARLNSDGSFDSTFSGDGKASVQLGGTSDIARSILIQPNGRILLGGSSNVNGAFNAAVVRLNADGTLDTSFDGDGIAVYPGNNGGGDVALALQADGSILLASRTFNAIEHDTLLLRIQGGPYAPTDISLSKSSVPENQPIGLPIATLTAADIDPVDTITFSLVAGAGDADNAKFQIVGNELRTAAVLDFETLSALSIRIRATDSFGETFEEAIALTVTNVTEAMQISSNGGGDTAAFSLPENTLLATTVTVAGAVGAPVFGIWGGADAARFTMNPATGKLSFVVAPNREAPLDVGANNSYVVIVQASDAGGGFDTQFLTITVTNQSETFTWSGGGANNNWSTPANWVGGAAPDPNETVAFTMTPVPPRLSPFNDLVNFTVRKLTLDDSNTKTFAFSGNALTLNEGITSTGSQVAASWAFAALNLGDDCAFGFDTTGTFTMTMGNKINLNGKVLTIGGNQTLNLSGVVSGAGDLVKKDTGILNLIGANTFTGVLLASNGIVRPDSTLNNVIPDSCAVTVTATGTLEIIRDETIGSLAGAGNVAVTSGTLTPVLTAGGTNASATFTGTMSGNGRFIKTGTGTLTFSGTGSYSGGLVVQQGVLLAAADAALGIPTNGITVAAAGTLRISASTTTSRTFDLDGTLAINAGATLTLTNAVIDGGSVAGPGTLVTATAPSNFQLTHLLSSLTIQSKVNDTFTSLINDAALTTAAGTTVALLDFINGPAGQLTFNGTTNASNFIQHGQLTVAGSLTNAGGSGFDFETGSVSTIASGATLSIGIFAASVSGALVKNSGTFGGSAAIIGDTNARLQGAGVFGSIITTTGSVFAPGNSPGSASTNQLNVRGGSRLEFEVANAAGAPGQLSGWDLVTVQPNVFDSAATLALTASSINKYTILLNSRLNSGDGNTPGPAANFNPAQPYAWKFADATNVKSSVTGTFNAAAFVIDTSGFQNLFTGSFGVELRDSGKNLYLVYTPPGTSVTGFTVNGGAVQRSRITSIDVSFSSPVIAATFQAAGAITLTRTSGGPATVVSGSNGLAVSPTSGLVTSLTLTFANALNAGINFGSLADSRWQLAVPSLGFQSTLNDPALRRLFGDSNGDGTVDGGDLGEFGTAFGSSGVSPFDFNNDLTVDGSDLGEFGARFGLTL